MVVLPCGMAGWQDANIIQIFKHRRWNTEQHRQRVGKSGASESRQAKHFLWWVSGWLAASIKCKYSSISWDALSLTAAAAAHSIYNLIIFPCPHVMCMDWICCCCCSSCFFPLIAQWDALVFYILHLDISLFFLPSTIEDAKLTWWNITINPVPLLLPLLLFSPSHVWGQNLCNVCGDQRRSSLYLVALERSPPPTHCFVTTFQCGHVKCVVEN